MKLGDWIKERIAEIREAHPLAKFESREVHFDVAIDGDGDVRLSGETRVKFSLFIFANVKGVAPLLAGANVETGVNP